MRILVVGDVHGSPADWGVACITAQKQEADVILCCGDVAYGWPGGGFETFKFPLPTYFIDGNHENFDKLWNVCDVTKLIPQRVPTRRTQDELYYLPRGTVWEWDGVTFMGFGGGSSIDKARREAVYQQTGTKVWWEQELIKPWQIRQAIEGLEDSDAAIDVLVTHDCPQSLFNEWLKASRDSGREFEHKQDSVSFRQRDYLDQVYVAAGRPPLHLHGHWHMAHQTEVAATFSVGLADCTQKGCLFLLDTADADVRPEAPAESGA